jgi:hypothetical protein
LIRVITSSTHRHYQDAAVKARLVPGLESDLENTREQLETFQGQQRADQELLAARDTELEEAARTIRELRSDLAEARQAAAAIGIALTGRDGTPEPDAIHTIAGTVVRHARALGLEERLAGVRERTVYLLYGYGRPLSAHTSMEAVKQAAHRGGADPDGWSAPFTADCPRSAQEDAARSEWWISRVPVYEAPLWPDPITEVVVLAPDDGGPHRVYGCGQAAHRVAVEAGLTVTGVVRLAVEATPTAAVECTAIPHP